MRFINFAAIIIFMLGCGQEQAQLSDSGQIEISYKELLSIPGDTIFTVVSDIELKENGNILVSETMRGYVSEFSPEGKFIGRIGNRGNGPGEFIRPLMTEIVEDSLFIFDAVNYRMNVFDQNGEFIRALLSENNLSNDLYRTPSGYINFTFNRNGLQNESEEDRNVYLNYDENLNVQDSAPLKLSDIIGPKFNPGLLYMFYTDPVRTARVDVNTFLLTQQIYTGKIYELSVNEVGEIVKTDSMKGSSVEDLYYPSEKLWDMATQDPKTKGDLFLRYKSLSLGLFRTDDGQIIHFVMKDDEKVREIGVEVFSKDYEFLGYSSYKTDSTLYDDDRMRWSFIKAHDGGNRFYTNGTSESGEAEIVVFELEVRVES